MTEKYFHQKIIDIPVYSCDVTLILSNDQDRVWKIFDWATEKNELFARALQGPYNKKESRWVIILNLNHSKSKLTHGTISHECLHVVNFIMDYKGVVSDYNNDEPECYLLQYMVNKVYDFVKKHNMMHLIV